MELQNVSKAYGGKPVLSHFSAVLAPGGRYALMGPSGVGKTTLRLVLGSRFPETDITAMLTRLDLTECLDTPAANLSGGQQRRSALARALLYGGELLVLDEPFTGLDEDNRRKALDAIRAYPKEAIVLLVTHSREDAEALGAEIIEI